MAANFDLTNLAVTGLAPGNELIYDNAGMPSIMVKIPKMTYKQLGMGESAAVHPAFIVNGRKWTQSTSPSTRTSCRMAAHTLLAALTLRHRWIWTTHASIARLRARAGT